MEYYGNTLCISAPELIETGIITQSNYKAMAARNRINVVRRGGGMMACYRTRRSIFRIIICNDKTIDGEREFLGCYLKCELVYDHLDAISGRLFYADAFYRIESLRL